MIGDAKEKMNLDLKSNEFVKVRRIKMREKVIYAWHAVWFLKIIQSISFYQPTRVKWKLRLKFFNSYLIYTSHSARVFPHHVYGGGNTWLPRVGRLTRVNPVVVYVQRLREKVYGRLKLIHTIDLYFWWLMIIYLEENEAIFIKINNFNCYGKAGILLA